VTSVNLIRWEDLSPHEQAAVRLLRIDQHQMEFAGSIEKAIEGIQATNDSVGLAILAQSQVTGFVVLARGTKTPSWAEAGTAALSAMRIDKEKQGQGLGAKALFALSSWVAEHWPEITTLTLRVDESNSTGIRAYEKAGFNDHGIRIKGRIGFERIMSKPCAPQNAL
jgi:RimJ/RimL family protein N-acetyltransferase